jgi:chemotaxis protein methyltransferase CheR
MIESEVAVFERLRDLVNHHSGLIFDDRKMYFFGRRVEARIEIVGASNATDYYQLLRYGDGADEMQALCESLTINETYFFREYPQLKTFAESIVPGILEARRAVGERKLRIWSAGCSTGEEPYTLAIILREMIEDFEDWDISIVATDISRDVLCRARRAAYDERPLKDVPKVYRERYFRRQGDREKVVASITEMVTFRQANLMMPRLPSDLMNLDTIFCRNVLIYFDDAARRQVVDMFHDALVPGGALFLGSSESVGRITSAYRPTHLGGMLVYVK